MEGNGNRRVTVDDVREVVRRYGEQNLGGAWDGASVMYTLGPATGRTETFSVFPAEPPRDSSTSHLEAS